MVVQVSRRTVDAVVVVALRGELDSTTAPAVQDRLQAMVHPDELLLVDLSGVPYMSSAGLRTMLLLYRLAQAINTSVGLVGVSDELRSMMAATGFLDYFPVSDTVDEGVRAITDVGRRSAS